MIGYIIGFTIGFSVTYFIIGNLVSYLEIKEWEKMEERSKRIR